jgi:hypothetical protein
VEFATILVKLEELERKPAEVWTEQDRAEYEAWLEEIAPSDPPEWFQWDATANG